MTRMETVVLLNGGYPVDFGNHVWPASLLNSKIHVINGRTSLACRLG